jgi:ammonium transporter, Amt family
VRKRALRIISGLGGVAAFVTLMPSVASAQDAADTQAILDNIWVFIAGALVFFMQAGFALVEAGLTRAKNVVNILAKNLSDALVGITAFYAVGFAFAYGGTGKWIGTEGFFFDGVSMTEPFYLNLTGATFFFFQAVFAATAVTIVSGAMAERMKFPAYLLFSLFMCSIIYPVVVHWTWGGGLISQINLDDRHYSDFAGSGVVHLVGGTASLVGAAIIGPRIGKYDSEGRIRAIPGHNIPFAILGVFILWLGWFGFNPGSELAADTVVMAVGVNTLLASVAGGLACTITIWLVAGKPDLAMIGNGVLAGLVSITAPCGTATPFASFVIGAVGGVLVVFAVLFFDRIKIDDPVGAISVHGVCGIWGVLSVGLFAKNPDAFVNWYSGDEYEATGLFYGGGIQQLLVQAAMVGIIFAWVAVTSFVILMIIKMTIGLRVSADEELQGLDILEHGLQGYAPEVVS